MGGGDGQWALGLGLGPVSKVKGAKRLLAQSWKRVGCHSRRGQWRHGHHIDPGCVDDEPGGSQTMRSTGGQGMIVLQP